MVKFLEVVVMNDDILLNRVGVGYEINFFYFIYWYIKVIECILV